MYFNLFMCFLLFLLILVILFNYDNINNNIYSSETSMYSNREEFFKSLGKERKKI